MGDLSVMPPSQALLSGGACEDVVNPVTFSAGLTYLQHVLQRDKYKNNISLSYTADMLSHYRTVNSNLQSQSPPSPFDDPTSQLHTQNLTRLIGLDIVRFSSQMADMCQKKNVKSINAALGEMGMREHEFISEIRHALTHKHLPSFLLAKKALNYLIKFIYESYWLEQQEQLIKSDLVDQQLFSKFLKLIVGEDEAAGQLLQLGGHNGGSNLQQQQQLTVTRIPLKRMGNIIADNLQTFRRKLNDITAGFVRNYDGQEDLVQIDNLKSKKHHLAYFLSEIFRHVLRVAFYAREATSKLDRDAILQRTTVILKDISADKEFAKSLSKINAMSFIRYKANRIQLLSQVYQELSPIAKLINEILPQQPPKKTNPVPATADKTVKTADQQPQTSSLEINKFGAFSLKNNHIPSLLGKKALETM